MSRKRKTFQEKTSGGRRKRFARPIIETLEQRRLMAVDAFEPNDTFETASILPPESQVVAGLSIHDFDDWDTFAWTAPSDGDLDVRIDFSHAQGDLGLTLYDAAFDEIGYADELGNFEAINDTGVRAGETYYIEVYGSDEYTDYRLSVTHTPGPVTLPPLPPPPSPCDADLDGSGVVDLEDLNLVRDYFGDEEFGEGDVNGDGRVDLVDLNLVRNNFGEVCPDDTLDDLRFTDVWSTTVDVRWDDEFDGETGYVVHWRASGAGPWQTAEVSENGAKYRIEGLNAETAYEVMVGARIDGSIEWLNYEEPVEVVTGPMQPNGIDIVARGPDWVDVRWTARFRDADYRADEYSLFYRREAGDYSKVIVENTNPGGEITYRLTGLSANSPYELRLRGRRYDDPTPDIFPYQSNISRSSYAPASPLAFRTLVRSPSDVQFPDVWTDSVDVRWSDNSDHETEFVVRWRPLGATDWENGVVPRGSTSFRIEGLTGETEYEVVVGARGEDGGVSWSTNVEAMRFVVTGPVRPNLVSSPEQGQDWIELSWNARFRDARYMATEYVIEYRRNGGDLERIRTPVSNPGGEVAYRLTGLAANSDYEIQVRAIRNDDPAPDIFPYQSGTSRSSFVPELPFTATTLVRAPTGIHFSDVWSDTVDVRWNDNSSHEESFVIRWRAADETSWQEGVANANDTAFRMTNLTSETYYEIRVGARGPNGRVSWSDQVEPARYFVTGPMRPANIDPIDHGRNFVELAWTARYRVGEYRATRYVIQYREVGTNNWSTERVDDFTPGGRATARITGLKRNTSYEFQIRAVRDDDPAPDIFPWQTGFSRSEWMPGNPLVVRTS